MKHLLISICILLLSFFAIAPLFHSGFFPVHDKAQPERIYEMYQSLHDGMFPVRWVNDFGFGYGYPLFNFYAPFAYYLGASFIFAGASVLISTKIVFGLAIIISGITMYFFAKEFWGKWGGVVSALLYVYAPYHAVETYVRGDLAELMAYGLIPLVFWNFYKVINMTQEVHEISGKNAKFQQKTKSSLYYIFIAALSYGLLIITHNLSALMITPFLFIFIALQTLLVKTQKLYALRFTLYAFSLSLILSAFYWLPVFAEMKYTNVLSQTGGGFDFHQHFVCWSQLWASPWGYGGSAPGCTQDGLSFMVGKISLILAGFSLLSSFFWKKEKKQQRVIWVSSTLLVIAALLSTEISKPVWESVRFMSFFQFPWRFLVMMSFFACFLSGASVWFVVERFSLPRIFIFVGTGLLLIVILIMQTKYFRAQDFFQPGKNYFSDPTIMKWELSQAASEYMPKDFTKPTTPKQLPKSTFIFQIGTGTISSVKKNTVQASAYVTVASPEFLHITIAYFPAWHIFIDGKERTINQSSTGMNALIPPGSHLVVVRFIATPIETIANIISLAGVIILILGIMLHILPSLRATRGAKQSHCL